jgi:hypothetical protein
MPVDLIQSAFFLLYDLTQKPKKRLLFIVSMVNSLKKIFRLRNPDF